MSILPARVVHVWRCLYIVARKRPSWEGPQGKGKGRGKDQGPAASAIAGTAAAAVCASGGDIISPALLAPLADGSAIVRSWLMHTRCMYELTSREAIPPAHEVLGCDAETPLALSTAKGYLVCVTR